jgi:gas vesicle protein
MSWEDGFKISTAILTSLGGGSAIVLLFSSWLGKVWAARILDKERHELEKLRKEHEIRFSKLHVERAEAIKEIAQMLQALDDSLHSILKDFQPVNEPDIEEKIEKSIKIHNEFVNAYKKHRIFFSRKTAELMHKIALCSRDAYQEIQTYPVPVDDVQYKMLPHLLRERDDSWKKARQSFYQDLQSLRDELEQTFRQIVGIIE